MHLKPPTALRNDYQQISSLAKASGEPVSITKKGEADLVVLSMEAFEEREKTLDHRASILEAEFSRLAGALTFTVDGVRTRLKEKYTMHFCWPQVTFLEMERISFCPKA